MVKINHVKVGETVTANRTDSVFYHTIYGDFLQGIVEGRKYTVKMRQFGNHLKLHEGYDGYITLDGFDNDVRFPIIWFDTIREIREKKLRRILYENR